MKRLAMAGLASLFLGLAAASAADTVDPSGTWKWTMTFRDQKREMSVTLKREGDKLTGSMPGREGALTPIHDGTYKDGEVSFKVTRERDGQKMTSQYKGKVTGDTLKGTISFEREGETQTRDWEAKRAK